MEIKVGEYVRTNQGYIAKLEDIDEEFMYFDDVIMCYYEKVKLLPINVEILDGTFLKAEDYVVKHSFNIIDLIEVGDYVNGSRVIEVNKDKETGYVSVEYSIRGKDEIMLALLYDEDSIKSIVTKEQFKAMEYEVK